MKRCLPLLWCLIAACDLFGPRSKLAELDANETRWRAAEVHDYDFDYQVIAMAWFPPVTIQVRHDLVTRVVNRSTQEELAVAGWPTIDSLFVMTRRDLSLPDYNIDVTYDAQYHFPAVVSGDIPHAVDDEFTRRAENVRKQ